MTSTLLQNAPPPNNLVPVYSPNFRLQYPTAKFSRQLPAPLSIPLQAAKQRKPRLNDPSVGFSSLVQQTEKVSLAPNLAMSQTNPTITNAEDFVAEEFTPTSEYLQGPISRPAPIQPSSPYPADSWTFGVLTSARLNNFAATVLPPKVQI